MVVTRTPPVIPTKLVWLALLIEIGVFGFLAQVDSILLYPDALIDVDDRFS